MVRCQYIIKIFVARLKITLLYYLLSWCMNDQTLSDFEHVRIVHFKGLLVVSFKKSDSNIVNWLGYS